MRIFAPACRPSALTTRPARVYRAHTTDPDVPTRIFAVKKLHTTKHVRNPMLLHEACAMIYLRGEHAQIVY